MDKKLSSLKAEEDFLQLLISSTFYSRLFCTKVFFTAFLWLLFGFVIFWHKTIGAKAARKMLMKLTTSHKFFRSKVLIFHSFGNRTGPNLIKRLSAY